jgi:RNA polymerase sigma factor (sigma-70 family)
MDHLNHIVLPKISGRVIRLYSWMDETAALNLQRAEQDRRLAEAFEGEKRRLLAFIRRRIPDEIDPEDLLQDVFYELVEAYRLMKPVAHAGAWMMQVARNRIVDLFRGRRVEVAEDGGRRILEELLPSPEAGPDAVYARGVLLREIEAALAELPASQREVFVAHEIDGRGFAEISAETGVGVKTLLSRKHYAVLHLRRRLREIYEELGK